MKSIGLKLCRWSARPGLAQRGALLLCVLLALVAWGLPRTASSANPAFDLPADLSTFTVLSCQDLKMSGNSIVTSEQDDEEDDGHDDAAVKHDSDGGKDAHVRSNGDVVLNGRVEVHGDAVAGPAHVVRLSGQAALVTGFKRVAPTTFNCTPINLVALRAALESANNNGQIPRTDKNRIALTGSAGRTLSLSGEDGLTLAPGTYLLDSLKLVGHSKIRIKPNTVGRVELLVTGAIDISGESSIDASDDDHGDAQPKSDDGGGDDDEEGENHREVRVHLWSAGTTLSIASQSEVRAAVYAPNATATLAGQSDLTGVLLAKSVDLVGGSKVVRSVPAATSAALAITLTAPVAGQSVTVCAVPVAGRISGGTAPYQLTINGIAVTPAADGTFATTASLQTADPGLVEVVASDAAARTTRVAVRVSIVEPAVALSSPASGSLVGSRTVDLAGSSGNATAVKVNGLAAAVAGDGTFHFSGFDLGAVDGLVTLSLSATNCGGSATATAILDLDTKAPLVSIDSPTDNYLASDSPIVVTGTVSDAHLTSVKVKGVTAQVVGQRFTAEGVALNEGLNPLVAVATDALGRSSSSATVSVELDSTAPGVTISIPENNDVVTTTTVAVHGTVTDSHPQRVVVNGVTATLSGNDFIANGVPVAEGENRIVATATDAAGHSASTQAVVLVRDTLPPTLTLDVATLPSLTENGTVTVRGTASDPHLDKVTVNGVVALVDGSSWAAEGVTLQEGANSIAAHAVDTLGHASDSLVASVVRDSLPPEISITEPAAGAQLTARTVTVRGTVSDPHLDHVSVLGVLATVTAGTFEAADVPLPEGAVEIAAHAADTLSHESDAPPVSVVVDTLAPVVSLDPPPNPALTTATVTVTGTILEPHLEQLTVAGIAATVNADGTFSVAGVPLVEGTNELRAVARDTFGHEATSGPVLYDLDTTAPRIAITSPLNGQVVTALQVEVSGTVSDAHLASVAVNGVAATLDEVAGTFSAAVAVADGANILTAVATDQAGHTQETAVTVLLDSLPPTVSLDQPATPAGGCFAAGATHTLGGAFGDANPASGQGGQPAPVAVEVVDASGAHRTYAGVLAADGRRWSASGVDLGAVDGVTTVLVVATDAIGNAARVSSSFRVDATAPVVTLLLDGAPFPGAAPGATAPAGTAPSLFGRRIAAGATVRDGAAAAPPSAVLTLDGADYVAGTPILAAGTHLLVATATDCAGHTATVHALFALDTTPPALLSSDPANDSRVTVAPTHFAGTSSADLARATVNGLPATLGANGAFTLTPFAWREGKNEVAIELEDRAGNRATYTVTFTARTAPLAVSIEESGAAIAAGTTFLRSVRPEIRPSDSTATVQATLNGAPFVSGAAIAQTGSYTVVATASDDWGRSARAEVSFSLDLGAAPTITITSPADGAVLTGSTVAVAGTVSGDAPTVAVNGVAATVSGSTWSIAALPLEVDVANTLEAVVRDLRGRTASTGITVRVVSGGPQILILEPADASTTNRAVIDVAGTLIGGRSRSADGKVTVQGIAIDLAPDGTFRAQDVPLASGANTLTVIAKDREQRTGTASVTVRADFTPPTLRLFAKSGTEVPLLDGASFGGPITLVVEVADDGPLTASPSVRLNGALQAGATAPRTEIALAAAGGYVLSAVVKDAAGNETRGERSFVLDFGGCALNDVEPVAGSGLAATSVTLIGKAVGAASIKVRVPGGDPQGYAASLADGTFLAGDLPLPVVGVNNLELVCTDASGRAVSVFHAIERLAAGAGPAIQITAPAAGAAISADAVAVSGTVSSGTVTVNGLAAPVQAGSPQSTFRAAAVQLAEGPNPILARALDSAGRSAEDRVVVLRDTQAPRVQITRPDNHSRVGVAGSGAAAVDVSGLVDLDTEPNLDRVMVSTPSGAVSATVDPRTGVFLAQGVPLDAAASVEQTLTATAYDNLGHSGTSSVAVTLDPAGPALVLSVPADLSRYGATATGPITVQGEAWAAPGAAISINGIDLDPALLAWEAAGSDGRRHVTFSTTLNLPTVAPEGAAFGIIARATDLQGRWAQDRRLLFRDSQAPRVVELVPVDGASGVDPNGLLLVLFSEPILHASLDATDGLFLTRVSNGQAVVGGKTVAGQAVAFAPGVALAPGEVYLLHAGRSITDLAGNPLASAAEARFTVAARSTSAAPLLDALPAVLCTNEIQIKGHAAAGTTIKVRDGDLQFTGFADAAGAFTVSVPVTGSGYHLLAAWALDSTTGARSSETSVVVRIDCQSPAVTDALFDRTAGSIRLVFSEAVNGSTLAVGDASTAIRLLDAEVPGVFRGGTVTLLNATTAEIHLDPAVNAWWRDRPVRLQVGPPAADPEGNAMTALFERVFFPGGGDLAGGFLFGEVYDDSTGRPQGGATVGLYSSGQALPGTVPAAQQSSPVTGAVADGRGRFVLAGEVPAGRYVLVASGAQTTRVVRHLSLRPSAGTVPFDSRVTPLAESAGALAPVAGGAVSRGGLTFAVDAAALPGATPVSVRLTPLSGQGLPDFLPLGWTPAAAAEIRLEQGGATLPESPLWTEGAARIELPLPSWAGAESELYAVRYEAASGRWIALPAPEILAAGADQPARVRLALAGPGAVAVVVPDVESANRPPSLPTAAGEALVGAERPAQAPSLTAELTLNPAVVSPTGRSRARVVARSSDGAARWPSGLAVQAYLEEKLVLTSGGAVFEAPFSADLVLYHPPLTGSEQGTAAAGAAGAMDFAVSPSPRAAQVLLDVGFENIRLFPFPEEVERGPVVGPDGGTVTSPAGVELTLPEGALSTKVPVAASLLTPAELAALPAIAGYDTLAGIRIELSGATLARSATLSLPRPSTTPVEATGEPKVILAEWLEAPEDGRGAIARLAARTQSLGTGQTARVVASPELAGTLPLDGIEREGLYLLLAAHQPLGFATGLVKSDAGQGNPLASSRVAAAGLGTGDLSRLTGRYAAPVAAGTARVLTALHPARDERGTGTISTLAPAQVASLDLVVQPVPPHVVSLSPVDHATNQPVATAVSVLFSEPLTPSTVTSSTLTLEILGAAGESTGIFVQGTVSLSDGVRAVFAPSRPLLPGRGYRATFTGGVADAGGTIYADGPVLWSFATSSVISTGGQVHPEKFHVRLPVNGIAEIYGDPGALPGALNGQPAWIVSPEIDGPAADPVRDSFQARGDGSFTGTVGHPPSFAVTLESKVYVKVFDPTGTLAAQFRVGPFTTPDGLGFVAPAGEDTTFRSAEGLVVDVPAAAFSKATLVKVRLLNPASLGVAVPQGLLLGGYVDLDFEGEARETLRVSVPAPAGVPDGITVFMGQVTQLPWGPRLQLLSVGGVLSRDGQHYMVNDPSLQPEPTTPATGPSVTKTLVKPGVKSCRNRREEDGLSRCFLQSLLVEFTLRSHAAFLYDMGTQWALLTGFAQPFPIGLGIMQEAIFNFVADSWVYVPRPQDWNGGFVLPVISGEPLELARRDTATGWLLGRQTYTPVSGSGGLIDVGFLGQGRPSRPLLIDAKPFQLFHLPAPEPDHSTRLSLELEMKADASGRVAVQPVAGFPLAKGSSLTVFDLSPTTPEPPKEGEPEPSPKPPIAGPSVKVCDPAQSWTTTPMAGSDDLLVVLSPGGVDASTLRELELQFDRPLHDLSAKRADEVARLSDLGPLKEGCGALAIPGYPKRLPVTLELSNRQSLLTVRLATTLPAGHLFRLELIPSGLVVDDPATTIALSYWESAPTRFDFATREIPGDPISGLPEGTPALGTSNVARDLLKLGNLLLVASETGDLVAFDASRTTQRDGLRPYALKVKPGTQYATRSLATDGHNRIFYSGLFGNTWGIKAIRLEDVRQASAPCVDAPDWAAGLPCFEGVEGSVRIAYSPGTASGTTASEWLALGTLPEAVPMKLSVLSQDEKGETLELADFVKAYAPGVPDLDHLVPDAEGIYRFDLPLRSTLTRSNGHAGEPSLPPGTPPEPPIEEWRSRVCNGEEEYDRYQRATVDNLTTGQSWSIDLENPWPEEGGGDGTGVVIGVRARKGDQLRVRYNLRTLGHVAMIGSGITVVDLNRFYRLTQPYQSPGSGQCGRRLGKFEGKELIFPTCAPPGIEQDGISMTPSLAVHSETGCNRSPCRGEGLIDIYSPLSLVGALHTRSTVDAPGGVVNGLFGTGAEPDALQAADMAACIRDVKDTRVTLRDVALANDALWTFRGVEGEIDGSFQEPPLGFKPQLRESDLLFVSLGAPGVFVFDVSGRSVVTSPSGGKALVGHLSVRDHSVFRLQVDAARGLLFAGGTEISTGKPVIDVWDIAGVNGAPGMVGEPAPRATLHAPWSTNQLGIDASGTGLLYTWGTGKGPEVVPFDRARFVFSGMYRPEGKKEERGISNVQRATSQFVPLGVPMETSLADEKEHLLENEEKGTAAFKLRIALPGSLGPELTAKVQSLRSLPGEESLGQEDVGASVALPGGPGWPETETVVRLRRVGLGSDEGSTGAQLTDEGGPLGTAYQLYESVETVLLLADPRARAGYRRQDAAGNEESDETAQCLRCAWPGFLPDAMTQDQSALRDIRSLLAGRYVRAFLFPTAEDGVSAATKLATEKAIEYFDQNAPNYPLPAGSAEIAGPADVVPSPVQVSLAEPALNAAIWSPDEAGVAVSLPGGEGLLSTTDHRVSGRAIPFSMDRVYRSSLLGYGALGSAGWSAALFAHLRELPVTGEVDYFDGQGHVWRFYPRSLPTPPKGTEEDDAGSYYPPVGVYLRLQKLSGGQGWRLVGHEHGVALFDPAGRMIEMADRQYRGGTAGADRGNRMLLRYDPFGQLSEVEDDLGRLYRFEYFDDPRPVALHGDGPRYGLLKSIKDFVDREAKYEFDEDRRLIKVKLPEVENPVPDFSAFSYKGDSRPTLEYHYDPQGGVSSAEDTAGSILHGKFAKLRLESYEVPKFLTGSQGVARARFIYDSTTGRVKQVGFPTPENVNTATTALLWTFTPDDKFPASRLTVRAPWGHEVEDTLQKGRVTSSRETLTVARPTGASAEPLTTSTTYSEDGRLLSVDRPDSSRISQCYADGQGGSGCGQSAGGGGGGDRLAKANLVRSITRALTQAAQGTADYDSTETGGTYQEDNQLSAMTDGEGRSLDLPVAQAGEGDSAGFSAEQISSNFRYDRFGRVQESSGTGASVRRGYGTDARGRNGAGLLSRVERGGGALWQELSYDKAFNVRTVRTSQGTLSETTFDDWDREVQSRTGVSENGRLATVGASACPEGVGAMVQRAFDAAGHTVRLRHLQDYIDAVDGAAKCRWVESRYTYNAREQLVAEEQTHLASPVSPGQVIEAPQELATYTYDEHGRLAQERARALSRADLVTTYEYDEAGRVVSLRTGAAGARRLGYDEASRVVLRTDGDEGVWHGKYDAWDRLYQEISSTGVVSVHRYDKAGNPTQQSAFDGDPSLPGAHLLAESKSHVTSFGAVDRISQRLTDATDGTPTVRVTEKVFDSAGRVSEVWSGPALPEDDSRVDRSRARRDVSIQYEPSTGRIVAQRYGGDKDRAPLSAAVFSYPSEGKAPWPDSVQLLESVPGRSDLVPTTFSAYRRDAYGRPIEERRSDGSVHFSLYDRAGSVIRASSGSGAETSVTYDGRGLAVKTTRPNGRGYSLYSYDLDGSLLKESTRSVAAALWETAYAYDSSGRVTTVTYADGTTEESTYNPDSTVATFKTRDGLALTYTYDPSNRLKEAKPAAAPGGTATTLLDAGDRLSYDPLSRPTSIERGRAGLAGYDPSLALRYPLYDLASRPASEVVGGRAPLAWTYDVFDRATSVTLPAGAGRAAGGAFQGFERTYDTLDRLTDVAGSGASGLTPTPLGARWDWGGAGRLYGMATKGALGSTVRFGYHAGAGQQVPGFDPGQASAWKLATLTWGSAGQSEAPAAPETTWGAFGFGYRGNEGSPSDGAKLGRKVLASPAGGVNLFDGLGWAWGYDGGVRLTSASAGAGDLNGQAGASSDQAESFRFGYGEGDQLTQLMREATGQIAALQTGDYGRITARNGAAYSYDGVGRRLEDDRFVYRWDWRGDLTTVTVKDPWPDGDGDGKPDVTPWAGYQVRYEYDAAGRLTHRWTYGKLPAGETSDAQRPFVEKRAFVWEGNGLLAEAAFGNAEESLLRWRKTYVPGPGGLDDAVQVIVEEAASGTARTYTLLRDEMGTVIGLVAEDEGSAASAAKPSVPVRYRYTPYGEVHAETGPELLRARFDGAATSVAAGSGTVVQSPASGAAAGSLLLDWTLPLDPATLEQGLVVERLVGPAGWVPLAAEELVAGSVPATGGVSTTGGGLAPSRLLVLVKSGWARGASYRVRLASSLTDQIGRRFGRSESLEWRIPEAVDGNPEPAVAFDKRLPLTYETWEAATNTVDNRFPGGQTLLFQGLWTDPVTGIAYARARWYDARNAVWLSEDPLGAVDSPNLYAFVGLQPNMAVDPLGLSCFGIEGTENCTDLERSAEFAKGEAKGLVNGVKGAVKGLVHLGTEAVKLAKDAVTDPVGTARRVATKTQDFVTNLDKMPHAVGQALVNGFDAFVDAKPEQQGEMFGEQVLTPILLGKIGETSEFEQMSNAARALSNKGLSKAFELGQEGLRAWTARREVKAAEELAEFGSGIGRKLGRAGEAAGAESSAIQKVEELMPNCPLPGALGNCFAAGTLVSTADGLKPIEEIQVGDRVYAFDEIRGEERLAEVVSLHRREADALNVLSVGGERIQATDDHPFYVLSKGWTETKALQVGDVLVTTGGNRKTLDQVERVEGLTQVYNFEVRDLHSYLVGRVGAVVHNCGGGKDKLYARGKFRKADRERAEAAAARDAEGQMVCPTCKESMPAEIEVPTKRGTVRRRGNDLDHYPDTWAERVEEMKSRPTPPSRKDVLDEFNRRLRAQCPTCNQGHEFEGLAGPDEP